MENGITRLYRYLANIKKYPTSLRAASCVSSVPEETIPGILESSGYLVKGGDIYLKGAITIDNSSKSLYKEALEYFENLSIGAALTLYYLGARLEFSNGRLNKIAFED